MSLEREMVLNIEGQRTKIQAGDLFQINFHGKVQCYITWHRGSRQGTFEVGKDKILQFKTPNMTKEEFCEVVQRLAEWHGLTTFKYGQSSTKYWVQIASESQ